MFRQIFNAYKSSFIGLSRETWLLSIVMFINRSGYMAVPFMSLYVTQFLHRPPSDAGLIITLFGVGSIIGASAGGKLTDMIGFRPVQIFSSIISGLFFLLFSMVTHFALLCLLTIIISFFAEAFRPANFTAIAAYAAPNTETRSYSLNRLMINIGWAVGSSLGGVMASINYKLLFIVDGSVSIIAGLSILWLLPSAKAFRKRTKEKLLNIKVRKPWEDALFMKFIVLATVFTTCFFLNFRVVPLFYKEEWHINEWMIGMLLGLNGVIIAIFELVLISKIENRKSPVFFIMIGVLFMASSYALLLLPKSIPILIAVLSVTLITIGEMFALPFVNTFVISRSNEYNRGQYAAGHTLSWSVAQVIGPTSGFYLAERWGYNSLWLTLTFVLICCAFGFRLLGQRNGGLE
ncbi:MFS transporter [Emticicia sp. CRIBPO]|uniref:MDR family MFS transporter n=1 Tax=Emticicia sp. CRIBPO TaxID=2683258 RepID=UPI001411F99B|nr:MFS transporter [Emticicia sp. CRIBPO]NBA87872.1 MFS transporter [Emticicia sp. CRIBPO]